MRIKADPTESLHRFKQREIEAVFRHCPPKLFARALELGAGDGYQSTLLATYVSELTCTDLNPRRLHRTDAGNTTFRILDAEDVGDQFPAGEFDLVYSSSLLEHLPDPGRALRGIRQVLRDDGLSIHLLPNRYWKLATILLYLPNRLVTALQKLTTRRTPAAAEKPSGRRQTYGGNNLKLRPRKQFFLAKLFLPRIHGVSNSTFAELLAFGKARWIRELESAGWTVLAVRKVAFCSGYHFGYHRLARLLERLGLYTVLAYVVCKRGAAPPAAHYWRSETGTPVAFTATTSQVCASGKNPGTNE